MSFGTRYPLIIIIFFLTFLGISVSSSSHSSAGINSPTANDLPHATNIFEEKKAIAQEFVGAVKDFTLESQRETVSFLDSILRFVEGSKSFLVEAFPHWQTFFAQIISFINQNKEILIKFGATFAAFFKLIFRGGYFQITSKMHSISQHKKKIDRGANLINHIQKQSVNIPSETAYTSSTFQSFFEFVEYNDLKTIKLVLSNPDIGFSSSISEYIRNSKNNNKPTRYLYYDMSKSPIKTYPGEEVSHLSNISAIIYSLLNQKDHGSSSSILKNIGLGFMASLLGVGYVFYQSFRNYYYVALPIVALCWFYRPFGYFIGLVTAIFFVYLFYQIIRGFSRNKINQTKIIIDNFDLLKTESQEEFRSGELRQINSRLRNSKERQSSNEQSHDDYQKLFIGKLGSLFKEMAELRKLADKNVDIIVIVRNYQFYKLYLKKLRIKSLSFKIQRVSQLTSKDIESFFKSLIKDADKLIILINLLKHFHNNSKEAKYILFDAVYDKSALKIISIEKRQNGRVALLLRQMNFISLNAERINQLIESQSQEYLKYVGIFLGFVHEKLMFKANFHANSCKEGQYQASRTYLQEFSFESNLLGINMDVQRYLFQRKDGKYVFKDNLKLLLLTWDEIIKSIELDNNWAESLQQDFIYYYLKLHPEKDSKKVLPAVKEIFSKVVDYLNEEEVISDHMFSSKSMALANFYLQEKRKEKVFYGQFQNQINKVAQSMAQIKRLNSAQNQNNSEDNIYSTLKKLRRKFQNYLKHEAISYEQGIDWLNHYFQVYIDCSINEKNQYLLQYSNNSYFLRPFVKDILIYWDSFVACHRQSFPELTSQIARERGNQDSFYKIISSKFTMCAFEYYQRRQEKHQITINLLGFKFKDLSQSLQDLQLADHSETSQNFINADSKQNMKQLLRDQCSKFVSFFPNQEGDNQITYTFQYHLSLFEKMLNTYLPNGMFKEINSSYRNAFYCFNGSSYAVRDQFRALLLALKLCQRLTQDFIKEKEPQEEALGLKLALQNRSCSEMCRSLTSEDWLQLFAWGQKVKEALSQHLRREGREHEVNFRNALLLMDAKSVVAAFCYSYAPKSKDAKEEKK